MATTQTDELYLYGGGGHGKVIIDIITARYGPKVLRGVFDDDPQKKGQRFYGSLIIGPLETFEGNVETLIVAIGDNATRQKKVAQIQQRVKRFATLIHPTAIVSPSAKIGEGTVVMPGAIVNADARIGNHCIINTGAVIEHDCVVEDFAHIAPNAVLTGGVRVGGATLVGANAVVVPYKTVGAHCLIAAGSVITKHIPDFALVRGNPGRVIGRTRR